MADATKEDLHDIRDVLSDQMEHGFARITARLDVLNGRVGKGEVVAGEHGVRITNVEREVWRRSSDPITAQKPQDEPVTVTRRDLKVAVAVLGGAWAGVQALTKIIPWLVRSITP